MTAEPASTAEMLLDAAMCIADLNSQVDELRAKVLVLESKLATPPPSADAIADKIAARLETALAANTRAVRRASMRK